MIGIKFDKAVRLLVLIMPKMSGFVETFKNKKREDKDQSNKLMLFCIDDENLIEKYKAVWTKIEDFKKFLNEILYQSMMIDIW